VKSLQQPDGSFFGDQWGEVDTRFSYCALSCLSLLGKLQVINVPKAVEFILTCKNFDGGFGSVPGAESHAGQSKNQIISLLFKPETTQTRLIFLLQFSVVLVLWQSLTHFTKLIPIFSAGGSQKGS
jgi:hypothetical protein